MLISPQQYSKHKDLEQFGENGHKVIRNVVAVGERTVLCHGAKREITYTKGAAYQLDATLPRLVYYFVSKRGKVV